MTASEKIVILVPTYNEAETICELIDKLAKYRNSGQYRFDLVVIDDNSPDKTADIVEEMRLSWVQLLRRPKKDGLGAAYRAGFLKVLGESQYSHVITMDADGSHRVEDLPALLMSMETSTSSKSLVIGTRWMPGGSVVNWPKYRQLLSKSGTRYAKFALGINLNDLTGGFRIYNSDLLNSFDFNDMHATGYCFQIEMAMAADAAGAKATQVPITFVERSKGSSKMNGWIALEAFIFTSKNGIKRLISNYNRR
jgi:dolichol-phosphate mannosyltransferase